MLQRFGISESVTTGLEVDHGSTDGQRGGGPG